MGDEPVRVRVPPRALVVLVWIGEGSIRQEMLMGAFFAFPGEPYFERKGRGRVKLGMGDEWGEAACG